LNSINKQLYYRLIALWAVSEGVLGGIIHGFNLPITGLIVGSAAVIIVCLLAFYVPTNGSILRATILVAVFKMMLSPQSPLPAYVAVFFQGITGEIIFSVVRRFDKSGTNASAVNRYYRIACLVFAVLALVESGVQRILVMTLLYGSDFWKAVNAFINGLTHQETITNYSLLLAGGYVLLHFFFGIFVGWIAGNIPANVKTWKAELYPDNTAEPEQAAFMLNDTIPIRKSHSKTRSGLLLVWIILILLFLQSELKIGTPLLSSNLTLHIIIRSLIILLTWYFLLSPLITYFLRKWLVKQQLKSQSTVNEILLLIPSTKHLLEKSWRLTSDQKNFHRVNKFLKIVLVNSLSDYDG
jgi:hypothetical protein